MFCYSCMKETAPTENLCSCCGKPYNAPENRSHLASSTQLQNGKFLVGRVLGQGGFGITYVGKDNTLDIKIAVKEYYPRDYASRDHTLSCEVTSTDNDDGFFSKGKQRFLTEARILAKFNRESSIVNVREYFEQNNTAYIIMDFVDGETLKAYLKKQGRVEPQKLVSWFTPILEALEKVHQAGLIHRDISPDNIIVENGKLILIDFGAARDTHNTSTVSVMLKPGYAPYEQYSNDISVQGAWTDVYAVCATMYECITGQTPQNSVSRMGCDNLRRPSELGISIPANIENALMKGMAVKAADRFQSIEDLLAALTGKSAPIPVQMTGIPAPPPMTVRPQTPPQTLSAAPVTPAANEYQPTVLMQHTTENPAPVQSVSAAQPANEYQPTILMQQPQDTLPQMPQAAAQLYEPAAVSPKSKKPLIAVCAGVVLCGGIITAVAMGGKGKEPPVHGNESSVSVVADVTDTTGDITAQTTTVPDETGASAENTTTTRKHAIIIPPDASGSETTTAPISSNLGESQSTSKSRSIIIPPERRDDPPPDDPPDDDPPQTERTERVTTTTKATTTTVKTTQKTTTTQKPTTTTTTTTTAREESPFNYDDSGDGCVILGMNESMRDVRIPSMLNGKRVVEIADGAFNGCDEIESVTIPNGVTKIGRNAFRNCENLQEVHLPRSIESIGSNAFSCEQQYYTLQVYFGGGAGEWSYDSAFPSDRELHFNS